MQEEITWTRKSGLGFIETIMACGTEIAAKTRIAADGMRNPKTKKDDIEADERRTLRLSTEIIER